MNRASNQTAAYGKRAGLLSIGIGITGVVTFAYFFLASHKLSKDAYGEISLLWSAVFIVVSVLYRPIEQLLARTVAERQTHGQTIRRPLQIAALIQLSLGALFAIVALAVQGHVTRTLFSGNDTLFWIMFGAVLAYAASYFGRGLLAGTKRVGLYGLLVFVEAMSRFLFALAVTLGILSGQTAVALGILAAPLLSLFVVPLALTRRNSMLAARPTDETADDVLADEAEFDAVSSTGAREEAEFTLAHGGSFAIAALLIMFCEQTFLNAGPIIINANGASKALVAFVFNLLLIARAPVQLFQSISTSLLPHLSTQLATGDAKSYHQSVRVTLLGIAGFAGATLLALLLAGPQLAHIAFGHKYDYTRVDLILIAAAMGIYLCASTLNQSALAARRTAVAAGCWLTAAAFFVVWLLLPAVSNQVRRIEIGFLGAACLLFASLAVVYWFTARDFSRADGGSG